MNKKSIAPSVVLSATLLSGGQLAAQSFDGSFSKRFYIGIGGGQSTLEPDTSAIAGLDLVEDTDTAANLTLGFDFSRRLTAEFQYTDLGTAALSDGDGITYAVASVSGLVYLLNAFGAPEFLDQDGYDRRTGLSLYGRLGIGGTQNDPLQTVQFERDGDIQAILGVGVEYALPIGLGIRLEHITYDVDAQYQGLTLLYRFGGSGFGTGPSEEPPLVLPELPDLPDLPSPEPLETLPPPPPPPPEFLPDGQPSTSEQISEPAVIEPLASDDSDSDGISDAIDECFNTPLGTPVKANGCEMFNGALEGVNFLTGSATLTEASFVVLDDVVNTMTDFPEIRISVQAHTDSSGNELSNLALSRQRALSVVRYLVGRGISVERFEARAFGQSQPIADNNTRAGRLLNRRVEFRTIQ